MSKNTTIICLVVVIAVIAATALGFWYFSRTNSITSKTNSTATKAKSSEKAITSFTVSELGSKASEVVDGANHTVTLIVPSGTDITKLTPTISVSGSATVSPASGVVTDFTNPVIYTVTAQDGSTQDYKVTVKIATPEGTGGS